MSKSIQVTNLLDFFKKKKRQGSYRRKQQKLVESMMSGCSNISAKKIKIEASNFNEGQSEIGVQQYSVQESIADENIEIWSSSGWIANDASDSEGETSCSLNEENFRKDLAEWAIVNQPPKYQLKQLLQICNKSLPFKLPNNPKTLMHTPRDKYPSHIHLNVNIDGLPLFESGKDQFWPILCNIHELSYIEPFVAGIFCGKSKFILICICLCSFACVSEIYWFF